MKALKNFLQTYSLFIGFSIIVLAIVEWLVRSKIVPSFIIPAPTGVVSMIFANWQPLLIEHLSATMLEFFIGFSIAVIGGILIAVIMFFSKTIEKIVYPAVVISQMIPIIALSPIFVLWFGYTIWSKVAVTFLICFFPIVVGTYDGLKSCDKEYIEMLRSMGANRFQIFQKLQIPMALPSFFSGFKMAIVFALVGATIGEWLGASEGLGYYSRRMSGNLNAEGVFAAITVLTIVGILLFALASWIEKRVTNKWSKAN
ncbi:MULTISPECIES: ABC transporter permease [unclassified Rummeliibacillus]|uniref:ABC transporter permease n=1 Tax=unclassified Rummeliibacillus TaxID=2622809 RepID=UPI000E6632D4|nr:MULTISPECIES: ABC transporter permease [unclassified Rummeliibacillus]RIJ66439.1 ABC transporter permease [Rummeliibacillus sp. POC4]RPJ94504.1 ABC transporter permease [Rummeliibacillus sp. TYF005]